MIVTVTVNPSIDRTIGLAGRLERGAVLRATSTSEQAGGKGVNIARAAVAAGLDTLAVIPVREDSPFAADVRADEIAVRTLAAGGDVRVNLTVTEPDGTTTKLNAPGTPATTALLDELAAAALDAATAADWVVLAGSLPPGAPQGWYADLVTALRERSVRVAVDTSEQPLSTLVAALPGAAPDLLKPNAEELGSVTGTDASELEADPVAAATAARMLVGQGIGAVLATLGRHGAVLVTADGSWHATPPPTTVVSTVGAGDSSLFGYLLGHHRGLDPAPRLALAVAYGSAAAGLPGTTIPQPQQAHPELVAVRRLALTKGG